MWLHIALRNLDRRELGRGAESRARGLLSADDEHDRGRHGGRGRRNRLLQGLHDAERSSTTLEDGTPAIELKLRATRETIAFQAATVAANAETLRPITLALFDDDGDLLHLNTFEAYVVTNDKPHFQKQLLDNRIVPVNKTLLTITNLENKNLPNEMFDPELLGESP
jgi:hypothetical protein